MLGSASPICWKMVSPLEASAPKAAMNPSMASLPLMVSGPAPEKAIASPKLTDFLAGAGGGGGGVAGEDPSVGGSSAARTTTVARRLETAANLFGRALVTDFMATDCIFVLGVVVCCLFRSRATRAPGDLGFDPLGLLPDKGAPE